MELWTFKYFALYKLETRCVRKMIVLNDDILAIFEVCVCLSEKLKSVRSLIPFAQTLIKKLSSNYVLWDDLHWPVELNEGMRQKYDDDLLYTEFLKRINF